MKDERQSSKQNLSFDSIGENELESLNEEELNWIHGFAGQKSTNISVNPHLSDSKVE